MKENELRLGNYLQAKCLDGEWRPSKMDSFDKMEFVGKCLTMKNPSYKPIPLTEEILLNCGFEKEGDSDISSMKLYHEHYIFWAISNKQKGISYVMQVSSSKIYDIEDEECLIIDPRIRTLHGLQNFIFSITGTELNIEL